MLSPGYAPGAAMTKKSMVRRTLERLRPVPIIGIPSRKLAALADERDELRRLFHQADTELDKARTELNHVRKELTEVKKREQARRIVTGF